MGMIPEKDHLSLFNKYRAQRHSIDGSCSNWQGGTSSRHWTPLCLVRRRSARRENWLWWRA